MEMFRTNKIMDGIPSREMLFKGFIHSCSCFYLISWRNSASLVFNPLSDILAEFSQFGIQSSISYLGGIQPTWLCNLSICGLL